MARVLIVDDHPVVREGLSAMLSVQPDFEVVGEAGDGATAISMASELRPEVILMDLALPDMDGAEAIRRIRQADPAMRIVVLTAYDTDERIVEAVQAGAQGYLLKGAPREELFTALRVVHEGGSLLHPSIASRLLARVSQLLDHEQPVEPLTEREMEVLRSMAQGARNKDIATQLCITERTVKTHMSNILSKLQMSDRTQAALYAIRQGVVKELSPKPT
ncbi:MAG: response regulator transcription factor, partial [Chloroflexi bacterium]|nr:response regulator transcription factor [Chloroflexota bacterium]